MLVALLHLKGIRAHKFKGAFWCLQQADEMFAAVYRFVLRR